MRWQLCHLIFIVIKNMKYHIQFVNLTFCRARGNIINYSNQNLLNKGC